MDERITLALNSAQLDTFCRQVRTRERSPADALRALSTLQAFVNGFSQAGASQAPARQILDTHCEQLRAAVLAEAAADIRRALAAQAVTQLADTYTRLSRSGFASALQAGLGGMNETEQARIAAWARGWLDEVAARSRNTPDAVDFRAAGITPAEYQAVRDLLNAL